MINLLQYVNKTLRQRILCNDMPNYVKNSRNPNRIVSLVLATPPWVKRSDFYPLVDRRDTLIVRTGIPHTFDHIVPINHPLVCGLNVHWNVRVVTQRENRMKSNKWCDTPDTWFNEPEQLSFMGMNNPFPGV